MLQVSQRAIELLLPGVEELAIADAKACEIFPHKERIILTLGAPNDPTPQEILDIVAAGARVPGKQTYPLPPSGSHSLLDAFAAFRKRVDNVTVHTGQVCALFGGREGLSNIVEALTNPGDVVIGPGLGYPGNRNAAINARCHYLTYSVLPGTDIQEEISKAVKYAIRFLGKVKVIITTPIGNFYGAAPPNEFYPWLIEYAATKGIGILSDEAYLHSLFEEQKVPSLMEFEGSQEIGVSLTTFSKLYNVPGWRLAFADGNKQWMEAIKIVSGSKFYGHYIPFQEAAVAALQPEFDSFFTNCGRTYGQLFSAAQAILSSYGVKILPNVVGGMFVGIKFNGRLRHLGSVQATAELYKGTGVRLNPGVWHGAEGDVFWRLALVQELAKIEEGCHRIGKFCQN